MKIYNIIFAGTVKIFAVRNPVEVLRHSRVELNCIVRSPPGEEYRTQWHKGLLLLKSEVEGYAPLVLQNVSQSDEGTYDCTVFSTDNDNDDEDDFDLVIVGKSDSVIATVQLF